MLWEEGHAFFFAAWLSPPAVLSFCHARTTTNPVVHPLLPLLRALVRA